MEELFHHMSAFEPRMVMEREVIADRGIWQAKKRYILNVHNSEGVQYAEPKMKIMGIEAIKSSTPEIVRDKFKKVFKLMIDGDEKGAQRAVNVRRSQQKERDRLQVEIQAYQTQIGQLNQERAPVAQEVRKIEAEVGPIKYIAELIYGASDPTLIDRAVRVVIICLIFVFDPLAILMVIAGNMSLMQLARRQSMPVSAPVTEVTETTDAIFQYEEVVDQTDPDEVKLHKRDVHHIPPEILERVFNKAQSPRPEHPHAKKPD
jgi:hypothetical protein